MSGSGDGFDGFDVDDSCECGVSSLLLMIQPRDYKSSGENWDFDAKWEVPDCFVNDTCDDDDDVRLDRTGCNHILFEFRLNWTVAGYQHVTKRLESRKSLLKIRRNWFWSSSRPAKRWTSISMLTTRGLAAEWLKRARINETRGGSGCATKGKPSLGGGSTKKV